MAQAGEHLAVGFNPVDHTVMTVEKPSCQKKMFSQAAAFGIQTFLEGEVSTGGGQLVVCVQGGNDGGLLGLQPAAVLRVHN